MAYKIEHLGLGGVLDQAIAITKNHFGLLFSIMLFLLVPFQLLVGFAQLAVAPEVMYQPAFQQPAYVEPPPAAFWLIGAISSLVGGLVILPLTNAAVIHAVSKVYLGQQVSAGEAIRRGLSRLLPLIWTSILMGLAIMGGFILLVIPGIIAAILFGLAQHVVVIEGRSGTTALKRSAQLVRPNWATFLVLGILLFVISIALGAASGFIGQPHVQLVVSTLLNAIVTILWTAAFVVFYFSCRCGVENFDLHYLAESVGAPAPEQEQPEARPTYGV